MRFDVGEMVANKLTGQQGRIKRIIDVGGLAHRQQCHNGCWAIADPAMGGLGYVVSLVLTHSTEKEALWLESQIIRTPTEGVKW